MNCAYVPVLFAMFVVLADARAQLVSSPVDNFERVRWGMKIEQLRAMSKDSALTRMVSTSGKLKGREVGITYWRGESVFGQAQRVVYRLSAVDSTLQQVAVIWVEVGANTEAASRVHDSLWTEIRRRYGTPTHAPGGGDNELEWRTATSIIKAIRKRGMVSGLVIMARPFTPSP